MLLGKTPFRSVLERLETDADDPAEDQSAAFSRIRGLRSGLAFDQPKGETFSTGRHEKDYFDNLGDEVAAPPEPEPEPELELEPGPEMEQEAEPVVMPAHLARTAPDEVAADLGLTPADTSQVLSEKRRAFAKENHPDRVAAAFRDHATLRMTIANGLIDHALRRVTR